MKNRYEVERAVDELLRRKAIKKFYIFLREAWPIIEPNHPFIPGWHIEAVCEHLEAVARGEIRNLLINIPPRHAKSTIVSVGFPAWMWTRNPGHRFIYGSHSFNLSKRDSIRCRSLVQSEWYRKTFEIKWDLASDQNEKMKFENTEKGYRMAASVGASVVGQGGDTLVIDDPHSPMDVYSKIMRESVLDWFDQEFSTRINDPRTASKIIIMQRLHENDLSQHVLSSGDWVHLMLPAEFEPERKCITMIGWQDRREEPGEVLWPERFGKTEIESLKKTLGSMAAAGQLQQRPAPAAGNIVKRDWWKFYKELPSEMTEFYLSADLTFKDGAKNDFSVFQVWGRKGGDKYLIDQVRARMGFNEQCAVIKQLNGKYKLVAKWIEDAANAAALIETLKKDIPGIIPVKPKGSKIARAEAVSPQIEAGNIYLPDPIASVWVSDFIEEWAGFPNVQNDDQVDAASQAISKLSEQSFTDWIPIRMTQTSKFYGR